MRLTARTTTVKAATKKEVGPWREERPGYFSYPIRDDRGMADLEMQKTGNPRSKRPGQAAGWVLTTMRGMGEIMTPAPWEDIVQQGIDKYQRVVDAAQARIDALKSFPAFYRAHEGSEASDG
jgi:hypothetical protein